MIQSKPLKAILASGFLLVFSTAYGQDDAQDTLGDEAAVWALVEEQWNSDEKGDRDWPDNLLADDFSGWNRNAPVPRDKSSIKMWDRFNDQTGKMVAHELYPYTIVIHGDVAVAQYLYSSAFKSKDGDISKSNGRYTDVMIRTEDGWKFLAWHGGDD